MVRNSTGRPGDVLFLTKPIGGGAVTTAAKRGIAARDGACAACTRGDDDAERGRGAAALAVGPSAMTDVTGFGLLGHLHELALASGVAARVEAGAVPAIDGALELLAAGALAGGSRRNREWVEPHVGLRGRRLPEPVRALLCDAMTSGGLLVGGAGRARGRDGAGARGGGAAERADRHAGGRGPPGRIAVM